MRTPYFDNARLALMFLVVLGHTIEKTCIGIPAFYSFYTFIYIFHIPAFTVMSGYFSKKSSGRLKKILKLAAYYIVFETVYTLLFGGSGFLIRPFWLLWFLFSLILWNLMLPLFSRSPLMLIPAVALGIAAGYADGIGYGFSLSRTLVFFPCFLAGYHLREKHFELLHGKKIRIVSAIAAAAFLAAAFRFRIPANWLYGSYGYGLLGQGVWYAGVYRLLQYAAMAVMCAAFFSFIPRKRFAFTYMGENTLNAYVLHGILVLYMPGLFSPLPPAVLPWLAGPAALLITAALSSRTVNRVFRLFARPRKKEARLDETVPRQ